MRVYDVVHWSELVGTEGNIDACGSTLYALASTSRSRDRSGFQEHSHRLGSLINWEPCWTLLFSLCLESPRRAC